MRRAAHILVALTLVAFAVAGCRHAVRHPLPRPVRVAVMPFIAPEDITEQTYDIRGWWFGAHDIRQNRNVGAWTAESLARQLMQVPQVEVVPPYDLRRYLQDQTRRLRRVHPNLSDEQISALLAAVPLSDYGRDLELDKIIVGQVFAARTSHNRTLDTWASTVDFQVQVWDVDAMVDAEQSGRVAAPEYEDRVTEREWFASWLQAADEVSTQVVDRMIERYFADPGYFRNL